MTSFADDIWAEACCNGVTALSSHVVMALQPYDEFVAMRQINIEQQTRKWTATRQFYIVNTYLVYNNVQYYNSGSLTEIQPCRNVHVQGIPVC